jgi:hypothetical protein
MDYSDYFVVSDATETDGARGYQYGIGTRKF